MKEIFDYFDLVKIINLVDRSDRRKDTIRDLEKNGVEIDDKHISFYNAVRHQDANGFPTIGARGSFTSHRETIREAVQGGHESLLVIEDDIHLNKADPAAVAAVLTALDTSDWDIVYLGYLEPAETDGAPGLISWRDGTLGGHFYGHREPFMSKMLGFMDACETRPPGDPLGGPMFRDGAFNHFAKLHECRIFIARPCLAGQRSSRTDLHDLRVWDRTPITRWMAGIARSAKNRLLDR